MGTFKVELAVGTIDGVNPDFTTLGAEAYVPGTMSHARNGLSEDPAGPRGLTETDPSAGSVTLNQAPLATPAPADKILLFFESTVTSCASGPLVGMVNVVEVTGTIAAALELEGIIEPVAVTGAVVTVELRGTVNVIRLIGTIEE